MSLQRPGRRTAGVALIALLVAALAFANTAPGTALAAVVPPTPPAPTASPAPEPEPPTTEQPAPTPAAPQAPTPEVPAPVEPVEPEATEPPATDPPAESADPAPPVDDPGIVTPLAAVAGCVGGNSVCGTLNIVNVVQGGSATPADWALRANIVGSDDWYDFTSGQTRRVAKPGSYTLEAIGTPGVTDDYTTTLSCFLNDTTGTTRLQFSSAEALLQYIGTASASLVASCTFTHTSTAPGTLVLSKGGERTGDQTVAPLAGATFSVYSGGTATAPDTSPGNLIGTCVTGPDGLCEVTVPPGAQYWVIETGAPPGYRIIESFDVGATTVTQQPYRLRTAVIPAGERVTYPQQTGGDTNLQARGSQWANAAVNPTLAQTCGLRVGLLVDLSNSLQSSQQDLRNAAAGFVDALEGTPSSIGIWTFAGGAPAFGAANTTLPLTPVSTAAGAATVRAKANGLTVVNTGGWEQGTNWDQGLWQVAGASTADTLDVLLVLTDGSPTYYGPPGSGAGGAPSGPGSRTRFVEMENAVASANALKIERGTSVVGVGIGAASAAEVQNLQAISGPAAGEDYFLVDDYADLQAFLEERALGECAGTVNVTKLVIPAEGDIGDAVPSAGWTFGAATDAAGVTVEPASGATNDTGAVSFSASGIAADGTAAVTITETQQPGFELVPQGGANAACQDNTGAAVPVTDGGELGFTTSAQEGGIVTCTVYNRAPEPTVSLRVDKAWVIDGVAYEDGTQPVGNADLTLDGEPRTFGTTYPQYTVGDTVTIGEEVSGLPSGCSYESSGAGDHEITADDPNVVTVTNTVTCITSLTLVKSIANGDAIVDDFTLTASPIGGTGLEGPSGVSGTTAPVTPGVRYLLAETGPATYVQTVEEGVTLIDGATGSWDCVVEGGGDYDGADGGVTVALGQEVTCTATNQTATIVLLKQVINDEGGTLTADAWDLTADPGGAVPGLEPTTVTGAPSATADNTFAVRPGQSYTLSEAGGGPGYRQFALEQLVAGEWVSVEPTVTIPALGTNTYRFVNVDVAPTLTLVKDVTNDDGGTAAATDWTLSATSPGEPEVTGVTGTDAVTAVPVFGGVPYTLAETGPDGYTWDSLTCDNGAAVSPSSPTLTLQVGEAVTCTFVNDDIAPTLTLVKTVTNAQGGTAEPTDWTLSATTPGGPDLTGISGDPAVTGATVTAGATYTLAESGGPAGHDWVLLSCDNGAEISPDNPTLTLGVGEDVTCTFGNTDLAGSLTIVKQVVNDDGGTAEPADWNQRLTAQPSEGDLLVFDHNETIGVPAGTYTLAESEQLAGYELTELSCTTAGTSPDSPTVTVPNGENVTCTFVNDDIAPTLTLLKTVVNDDGGTSAADEWTLSATTPDGPDLSGATGTTAVTAVTVPANSEYTLAETGPEGYDWSSLSCDNGADASVADPTLSLALDEDVTCTFVNDNLPGTLTLLKQVVNDDGGTAEPADWNQALTAQPDGGTAIPFDHDVSQQVSAGEYTLAESGGPEGYEWTALACSTGSTSPEAPTVTVANGDQVTCSFTNDDVAPTLTLVKTVTNTSGGAAEPTEWTLEASTPGGPALSGVTGTPDVTAVAVPAGAEYTLAESGGPDGYDWTSLACDNGATVSPEAPSLTLGLAEDVTCTFGNTDLPGSLTLVKDVDNTLGGSAVPEDWDQRLTAQPAAGEAVAFDHDQTQTVPAGSYTLAEIDQIADYEWTALSCDTGGVTLDSPVVTIANGQAITCTFTNAAIAPTLTLVKNVDNQDGVGTATPEQWTLNAVAGESDPLLSGEGTRTGATTAAVSGQVAADVDYTLSETFGPSGYTAGDWACVETEGGAAYPLVSAGVVRLSLGVDVTCEIVNTAIRAEGTIDKQVADGSPVQGADGTWTISYDIIVTNNSDTSNFIYSLADELQYGEGITPTAATWTGPDDTSGTFTLPAGTAALATDVSLPTSGDPDARATHTYTVTVTAEIADGTQDGDAWRCDTAPGVPTAGGFLNAATLSATDADDQTVFGCAEPAFPALVKTGVDPATQNPDASWNVSYTLTLSNPGAVAVQAALTDTLPDIPDGWELGGGVWTIAAVGDAPAPTAATAGPGETAAVWTGQLQPAASLAYTVSGVLIPTVEATDPGECATGGGIVNTAGVTSGEIVVDAEGCVTVQIAGVSVDKSGGAAQQLPDGQWQIDYVVTVANTSDAVATVYTLTDAPDLGDGIVLVSGEWVGTAPAPDSPLAAGATAEYTFRIVATIDPGTEDPSLECEPGEGGAFYNTVTAAFPGGTDQDDGCADPGGPTVTKTAEAATPLGAGVWALSYVVTVSNTSGVTVAYTLEDRPEEPTGGIALVTPWTVTGPVVDPAGAGTATLTPGWDGVQQPTAATGLLPDGATHTYTVTGQVSVVDADPDALTCGQTPQEGGVWNTAGVDNGAFESTDEGCSGLTVVPVELEKSDGTVSDLGDGRWRIDYVVTVTNPGLVPTTYTLTDAPQFDPAFTILAQGWVGSPNVADVEIPAGGVDTYTYRVDAASVHSPLPATALECTADDGGGFFNTATATHPGGVAVDSGCAVAGVVPPSPPPGPGLAGTGGTLPTALAGLGAATLIGGILLLLMRRRHRHRA